jgi:hypothetical protein
MWMRGRGAALDVTVTSPLQAAMVDRVAAQPGAAAEAAQKRKSDRYSSRCDAVSIDFVPLAVDTLGGWHPDAILQIGAIARNIGRRADKDQATSSRHLFQKLRLMLQRGNAILLAGRRPQMEDQTQSV